jgi:hypothetical protein
MRRKRWVVYGVIFEFGKTKPERLDIISRFRTRREAVECANWHNEHSYEPMHVTHVPRRTSKPYGTKQERWVDKLFRLKFGLPTPISN